MTDEDTSSDTLHKQKRAVVESGLPGRREAPEFESLLVAAIEYAAQLEDKVERLVDPDVEKLVYEDGVLEAWLGDAPALKLLTASLGKTLDEHEAENYLQVELKAEEQPEPYKVVVHRPGAKTPHDKREEAEAEREEAHEALRIFANRENWNPGVRIGRVGLESEVVLWDGERKGIKEPWAYAENALPSDTDDDPPPAPEEPRTAFRTTIWNCARCGDDHEDRPFYAFTQPPVIEGVEYAYWGICPVTADPILNRIMETEEDDARD